MQQVGQARLRAVTPRWVTMRGASDDERPVVAHLDEAVAFGAPYMGVPMQVGLGRTFEGGPDGLPLPHERVWLRELEQRLVDLAASDARLVAVITFDQMREWVLYTDATAWLALVDPALTQSVVHDPLWAGLLQLVGMV